MIQSKVLALVPLTALAAATFVAALVTTGWSSGVLHASNLVLCFLWGCVTS